jgi:hypothetical protein
MTYEINHTENSVTVNGNKATFVKRAYSYVFLADVVIWLCKNNKRFTVNK